MFGELYHNRVLELAANIPNTNRLQNPHGSAEAISSLCGSKVAVDIKLDTKKRICAFAIDPRACALGQASSSILSRHAIGKSRQDIETAREQLKNMLDGNHDYPHGDFSELRHLQAVRDYPQRYASVLLAFNACLNAFNSAS